MDVKANPPHRVSFVRGLVGAILVLTLAALSAAGTVSLLSGRRHLAVGGPVSVHPGPRGDSLSQELPGGGPQGAADAPVTAYLSVGPHLTVPILYYHYVRSVDPTRDLLGFELSVAPALFAEQMALLHVEGAHPITMAQLAAALAGRGKLPSRPVILTFDDGYADFATVAEPVLSHFGFVAIDYVVSGLIGRIHYMTAAQVLAVDAAGMVIGSHTVHHVNLARVSVDRARAEIDNGKAALEQLLGHPVLDFAYPFGGHNGAVVQLVRQAGFRDAVSTMHGDRHTPSDIFLLRRIEIGGAPSLATFAGDASLTPPTMAQIALAILAAPAVPSGADPGADLSRAA